MSTVELEDVNTVMGRRLAVSNLDPDQLSAQAETAIAALTSGLDSVMPMMESDPLALSVLAEALRSYADVAANYSAALRAQAIVNPETS